MCWIGVLWPQEIWSRVRPKTAATLSRSAGLGVHRPSAMASTRDSSSPGGPAASCTLILCAWQRSLTLLSASIVPPSRAAAELRAVAVDVRHRVDVPPGDLLRGDAEGCRQPLPLLRARGVAAVDDPV